MTNDKIYTIAELSQFLNVSEDDIQKEIDSGRLRALRIGGFTRIRESALTQLETTSAPMPSRRLDGFELTSASDFSHIWPDRNEGRYTRVR
jgi:excisionase family DNA binding protein